jgi:hypothetical protein
VENKVKVFENKKIRSVWDQEKGEWFFCIVDVVEALTESENARSYWYVLKNRLGKEGSELLTFCKGLTMMAPDGKMRSTDALDTKGILRLIQSIPSKKAEPFKLWLASMGEERLNEVADPEQGFHRLYSAYKKKGYSEEWVQRRLQSIETRQAYETELRKAGITEPFDYALLTNEMLSTWSGMTTKEYKDFKNIKPKENLRDNMSRLELVINMLGEETATEISKNERPQGLEQSKSVARRGGNAAFAARKQVEIETGRKVVTSLNFKQVKQITKCEGEE